MGNKPQGKNKIYYPRCTVCAYMRDNQTWYAEFKKINYFDPTSPENAAQFFLRTAPPFSKEAYYRHLRNHTTLLKKKIALAKARWADGKIVKQEVIDLKEFTDDPNASHVDALDDVINKFHNAVRQGKIPLTLQGGLQAIKIKADIEKSNKDRKVDLFKAFSSMGNKSEQRTKTNNSSDV